MDTGEWIDLGAAVGAVLVGLVSAGIARNAAIWAKAAAKSADKLAELEQARDNERAEAASREQAAKITAWFKITPVASEGMGRHLPRRGAEVRNGSDAPTWDVQVHVRQRRSGPAGSPPEFTGPFVRLRVDDLTLPPGEHINPYDDSNALYNEGEEWGAFVQFRDANDKVWHRDGLLRPGPLDLEV
ncbi:hypothetical protein [Cryptosporangium sp. NPDC048952]|uniref:hypothetical protein n=1 Tax=Cryptosporangium sp. NPDC048952 TaxID=3363961 RepID=UPI0037236A26